MHYPASCPFCLNPHLEVPTGLHDIITWALHVNARLDALEAGEARLGPSNVANEPFVPIAWTTQSALGPLEQLNVTYAMRDHVVTDQGNGGAYCSNCGVDLSMVFAWTTQSACPQCKLPLREGNI